MLPSGPLLLPLVLAGYMSMEEAEEIGTIFSGQNIPFGVGDYKNAIDSELKRIRENSNRKTA